MGQQNDVGVLDKWPLCFILDVWPVWGNFSIHVVMIYLKQIEF